MRFSSPGTQADHFERDGAIETFLMGAINHALTAASDFPHQLVVSEVSQDSCGLRGCLFVPWPHVVLAAGVNNPGHGIIVQQTKACC